MTSTRELRGHRQALLERCATERARLGGEAGVLLERLHGLDRGLDAARRVVTHPVFVAGAVAVLAVLGRSRSLRLAGRVLGLAAAAWRMRGVFASLRGVRRSSGAA